jgi:hypothetical protein
VASWHLTLLLSAADFALYATKIALEKNNVGALARATNAASFLAELNGWSGSYAAHPQVPGKKVRGPHIEDSRVRHEQV